MFELLKVEKIIIFSKKLRVRIIRASELIEDIRYINKELFHEFGNSFLSFLRQHDMLDPGPILACNITQSVYY